MIGIYISLNIWKKNEANSLSVSEVTDFERRAYLNA